MSPAPEHDTNQGALANLGPQAASPVRDAAAAAAGMIKLVDGSGNCLYRFAPDAAEIAKGGVYTISAWPPGTVGHQ